MSDRFDALAQRASPGPDPAALQVRPDVFVLAAPVRASSGEFHEALPRGPRGRHANADRVTRQAGGAAPRSTGDTAVGPTGTATFTAPGRTGRRSGWAEAGDGDPLPAGPPGQTPAVPVARAAAAAPPRPVTQRAAADHPRIATPTRDGDAAPHPSLDLPAVPADVPAIGVPRTATARSADASDPVRAALAPEPLRSGSAPPPGAVPATLQPRRPPPDRPRPERDDPPSERPIEIVIDRVDVRLSAATPRPPRRPAEPALAALSLADYLERRRP